jgi:hypothetical protein
MRRVDPIAGEEIDHDDTAVTQSRFSEELGSTEREKAAYARGQGAQCAYFGGQLRRRRRVRGNADDDTPAVVEVRHRRVVPAGRALGEGTDPDHRDPRKSQRDGRG